MTFFCFCFFFKSYYIYLCDFDLLIFRLIFGRVNQLTPMTDSLFISISFLPFNYSSTMEHQKQNRIVDCFLLVFFLNQRTKNKVIVFLYFYYFFFLSLSLSLKLVKKTCLTWDIVYICLKKRWTKIDYR